MELSQWLQGGPFLEVSFLWELSEENKQTVQSLIKKLSSLSTPLYLADGNLEDLIKRFETGHSYNEEAPIHSLELRLEADIAGKRKAVLRVEQLSSNALLVDFLFFGSQFDAPEWNQLGVKDGDLEDFIGFLVDLYSSFRFKAGGIALEEDIRELFDCREPSPSDCYRFEKLSPNKFFQMNKKFYAFLWNENYGKLQDVRAQYKRIEKSGVLVVSSDSYSEF